MVTRRALLRQLSGVLSVAGAGAMAGCSSFGGGSTPASSPSPDTSVGPKYVSALYDPTAILDARTHGFLTYDLGALYDHRNVLPSEIVSSLEQYDQRYEAVSLSEIGRLTVQGYTSAPLGQLTGQNSGSQPPAGGTALLTGAFKPDRIVDRLRQSAGQQATIESIGSVEGYTLYTLQSQTGPPGTIALSDEGIGGGLTTPPTGASGEAAVRTMLDAQGGGSAYPSASSVIRQLTDTLGSGTTVTGVAGNFDALTARTTFPTEALRTVLRGIRGVGSRGKLTDERFTSTTALVYDEGATPSRETVQQVVDWLNQRLQEADSASMALDDISISVDGRVVTATTGFDPQKVFTQTQNWPVLGGAELFALLIFPPAVQLLFARPM